MASPASRGRRGERCSCDVLSNPPFTSRSLPRCPLAGALRATDRKPPTARPTRGHPPPTPAVARRHLLAPPCPPLPCAPCRSDLWIMFVLKVLESYNYFSLSRSFTLYLTEEFGVGDYE